MRGKRAVVVGNHAEAVSGRAVAACYLRRVAGNLQGVAYRHHKTGGSRARVAGNRALVAGNRALVANRLPMVAGSGTVA